MRLTDTQIGIIKARAAECYASNAHAWLFGSRLDGDARGGDIELSEPIDDAAWRAALQRRPPASLRSAAHRRHPRGRPSDLAQAERPCWSANRIGTWFKLLRTKRRNAAKACSPGATCAF
jgi:hypothetical protein